MKQIWKKHKVMEPREKKDGVGGEEEKKMNGKRQRLMLDLLGEM